LHKWQQAKVFIDKMLGLFSLLEMGEMVNKLGMIQFKFHQIKQLLPRSDAPRHCYLYYKYSRT